MTPRAESLLRALAAEIVGAVPCICYVNDGEDCPCDGSRGCVHCQARAAFEASNEDEKPGETDLLGTLAKARQEMLAKGIVVDSKKWIAEEPNEIAAARRRRDNPVELQVTTTENGIALDVDLDPDPKV